MKVSRRTNPLMLGVCFAVLCKTVVAVDWEGFDADSAVNVTWTFRRSSEEEMMFVIGVWMKLAKNFLHEIQKPKWQFPKMYDKTTDLLKLRSALQDALLETCDYKTNCRVCGRTMTG